MAKFGPKPAFCPFCPMPDQKTMRTTCLGIFSVMWVLKLLLSPVKLGFFAQSHQIWPENSIFGNFEPGLASSIGALLVVCLAVWLAKNLITLYKKKHQKQRNRTYSSSALTSPQYISMHTFYCSDAVLRC